MNQQESPKKKRPLNSYAKFSGIAFQMIAIIAIGSFIGVQLDEKFPNEKNWYTISLTLLAVILSVIAVIKNINTVSKKIKDE